MSTIFTNFFLTPAQSGLFNSRYTLWLRYEYEHTKDQAETETTTREDETEFRVNYAFDQRKTSYIKLIGKL